METWTPQGANPVPLQTVSSRALLKEWAITGEALAQGRQLLIVRKGGLLDEDGAFTLEHSQFFLLPTHLHQEKFLTQPPHHDLFEAHQKFPDETPKIAYLRGFGRVEAVWRLYDDAEIALQNAPHIWSERYFQTRFGYQSDKPLLCAALRYFVLETPLRFELRAQDMGCRSWIELEAPLQAQARPAIGDAEFASQLEELQKRLG